MSTSNSTSFSPMKKSSKRKTVEIDVEVTPQNYKKTQLSGLSSFDAEKDSMTTNEEESENGDSEDGDEDGEEDDKDASSNGKEELPYLEGLVEGLTKDYLKAIMKGLPGFRGSRSGTNKQMVASIIEHLRQCVEDGGDLDEEGEIIKSQYKRCYGDSEEEGEDY